MRKYLYPVVYFGLGLSSALIVFTQTSLGTSQLQTLMDSKLTFADGSTYTGETDPSGILNGRGLLRWTNGDEYTGNFSNGLFDGQGRYTSPDLYTHVGEYRNGRAHGFGVVTYVTGDKYEGDFVNGDIEGEGTWKSDDGSLYSGMLRRGGVRHGKGEFSLPNGDEYRGEFKDGMMHGVGRYTTADGDIYEGDFVEDSFTGQGSHTSTEGRVVIGQFESWTAKGKGEMTDEEGNRWVGEFDHGVLTGKGTYNGTDGSFYEGGFEYNYYEGKGRYRDAEGNIYEGEFSSGNKHGEGIYTYAEPVDDIKTFTGKWKYGTLIEGDNQFTIHSGGEIAEHAIYNQQQSLEKTLAALKPGNPDQPDLFVLGIAGWGEQEVFHREIKFLQQDFLPRFHATERAVFLVNSQRDIHSQPLATITSIEQAILRLGEVMDKDDDILLIYATSHGSRESGLALDHRGLVLTDLSPDALGDMLDKSGIKHKVVVVSACYSGIFVNAVKSPTTMVLTASSEDRRSFGCADESRFTYFGQALLEQAIPYTDSFSAAFEKAKSLVEQREQEEDKKPSKPQIHTAESIELKLREWRKVLGSRSNNADAPSA